MNAQFVPRRFREVYVVVACSFLDVGERQSAIGIGDVDDLIETRNRITACCASVSGSLRRFGNA
jgi:hypothetical protein